jgi:hypothetical protein
MGDANVYRWEQAPSIDATAKRPSARTNLTKLYQLEDLAYSVRRQDEAGNKINRQSKTYKKQIIDLGVLGGATIPSATSRKYLMDLLMSGAAQRDLEGGYRPFSRMEMERGFALRPGALQGYTRSPVHETSKKASGSATPAAQAKRSPLAVAPKSSTPQDSVVQEQDSSDDGSNFKEHDRERRKRKLLVKQFKKRESDTSLTGDFKRQRTD